MNIYFIYKLYNHTFNNELTYIAIYGTLLTFQKHLLCMNYLIVFYKHCQKEGRLPRAAPHLDVSGVLEA